MSTPDHDTPPEDSRLAEIMRGGAEVDPEGSVLIGLPHSRAIGMRVHLAHEGVGLLSVPYDARLVGDPETGVLHGGVITSLLDTACGIAVMASKTKLIATATLDLRIDYMRPATMGLRVWARAECHRLTRAIAFARAVAYHEDTEDPIASAAGAFVITRPAGGATAAKETS
ncbi:MAG: PaaI family thioesterase [Pseudomonadota bacterium]